MSVNSYLQQYKMSSSLLLLVVVVVDVFDSGPPFWGSAISGGPLFRRTAINDDLALTLTTEQVYKNIFLPGEGALPLDVYLQQLCPLPRPLPRIPPPYC